MKQFAFLILIVFSQFLSAQESELKIIPLTWEKIEKTIKNLNSTLNCYSQKSSGFIQAADQHHIDVSILTMDEAMKYFTNIKEDKSIPFKYPEDGCYARAHKMSWAFDDAGIDSAKIFVEGNLEVKTKNTPDGTVNWWYHVAPVVLIDFKGVVEPYVFDPSLFEKPVKAQEWVKVQTSHEKARVDNVYFTERFNYYPYQKSEMVCEYSNFSCNNSESVLKQYKKIQDERFSSGMPSCQE